MFGYVKFDKPNLYIKDYSLYNAVYCGLCKSIGKTCGNIARFTLSYDVAFFSVILHNITGLDVKITRQRCIEHPILSFPMAETDELTDKLGALNTVLTYYKLTDDVEDDNRGRFARLAFRSGRKRVLKKYPEIENIVRKHMTEQSKVEKAKTASVDMAADATALMVSELSDYFLGQYATEYTKRLFYALGKWIYLIDALDDYDKDIKKKHYNPFVLSYGDENKKTLLSSRTEDIDFMFSCLFKEMWESRQNIKFRFNAELVDNILFGGLPKQTKLVLLNDKAKRKEEKNQNKRNDI